MGLINPCKEREPRVIDNDLIQMCILRQYSKGEVGRLVRLEGIPFDELEEISFEFLNILKIDHLWMLTALTKLKLNNNFIEKIEHLETLVNLREVDLSFNKINKIENLEALEKIEKLSLYENHIEVIENLDNQKLLSVFSIGHNRISRSESVYYLRKFRKLASLNMAHNPCAEAEHFRSYIAAFLPKLVYYEYKRIDELERDDGCQRFEEELTALQKVEDEENAKTAVIEKMKADAEIYSLSFVEYLNTRYLFDQMFEDDIEGLAFLDIGEDVEHYYKEFEEQFLKCCMQIFDIGQKHYALRTEEIEQFQKTVETAKKTSQEESIRHMEVFVEAKTKMFDEIRALEKKLNDEDITEEYFNEKVDEYSNEFSNLIHELWKILMKLELQLFEQMDEVNGNFGHVLTDMINVFMEEAQAAFSVIRTSEVTYTENIADAAGRLLTSTNINDDVVIPESLTEIMYDKESVNNAIGTTHDKHMLVIDTREDTLVSRAKKCAETFTTDLVKEEIARNRYKILEINHFLDVQREEFEDLIAENTIVVDIDDLEL
ncbi:hypothetical protein NQ317_008718 [Molorchus minor]|uniref:Dynein axonemal assembly factor 1 homolog n=1 Tax=Molorchus minor TaxID=1323400 RepID=A0ABQ9IWU0_9CUCU|nr:hypothetical protein NQ317_008718 [Molorchus minor]